MRWRWPTPGQATFLAVVLVVTIIGAAAIVHFGRPDRGTDATSTIAATTTATPRSDLPAIAVVDLPEPAGATLALIDRGGPFPYRQDGTVFGNLEGLLPPRDRGYYREYTIPTPGSDDRGARRFVVGAGGDVYYTDDHYASFHQVLR
jgi:ribonuclease T1